MKLKLFSYAGIPVYADASMLLVVLLVFMSPLGIASGISMAGVLFGSILLHEFGHAIAAQRIGYGVRSITLMIMGGAAEIEEGDTLINNPREEVLVSSAGPAVNVVLVVTGYLLLTVLPINWLPVFILGMIEFMVTVNLMLGIFNLVPIYPLDGGRMARAVLVNRHGFHRGSMYSFWISAGLGSCLLVFGLWAQMWMLAAFMGYMIFSAHTEYKRALGPSEEY